MIHSILKIVQLSDMHLFANPKKELLGVKTQASFQAVLDLIKSENEQLDLIILSGDLSQDASKAAYQRIANMLRQFNVPAYWIPGNHDSKAVLKKTYPYANIINDKHVLFKNWQLILLDSQKPHAVEGKLSQTQFKLMENCLKKHPTLYSLIMFHHQAVPVGSEWLDKLGLSNAKEFWRKVAQFPLVKNVVCGHVHQDFYAQIKGVDFYTSPSTCIQFKPNQAQFGLEKLSPGYRWLHLYPEGKIKTGIKRTTNYIGKFDQNTSGY